MDDLLLDIGHRIRERRIELGLTQEQLAEKAELSPKYISIIENAKKVVQLDTFIKVCDALTIDYTYVITGKKISVVNEELQNMLTKLDSDTLDALINIVGAITK